ncbi:RHS repeat domain-containing protein [Vibrio parahaemolyticus]|uniref:RHS repeat domain-containing protein n=1 Tax=Vibrio parahaemolyticus TaxID=670 RepID=UPI0022B5D5F6|nr:RHS repeat domain-containing protein [Vibrio parahaemolyticus]MCZ6249652.1 RHS repeat protein [Vibrio parahaemolyticus]MCZ6279503.1 RHS repeat protein [Vibrio parahaemolyticus]MCZ6417403.1 RHS repeat protein [Vibrio parahaemolyticus]MEA5304353.1 RHS repeat domain-containing protein [Vibrio parahaemolyticus]
MYASNTEAEKAHNLAGQCISHYDTAGLVQTDSIALTGVALSVSRRLLKDADNPDVVADWQGGDASVWNEQLSKEDYVTLTTTDATGTVLTTIDTKGNVQRVAYDVSGLMSGSWLTLKGKAEQTIVKSLTYSAAGQKPREEQGNGVVTTYSYEPETQRLIGIKTERPTGHALGAKVLQDLRYEYDPVGNVVTINNDAEETRFWRNQKVVPENTYTYDSLYQLVQATGREMANAGQQSNHLPSATIPFSSDSSAYTNYTRTYTYDEVGNLTRVKHSAPATNNNYTTTITVSDSSNRSVQNTLTENASDVDGFFTVGGQQKQLQLGQPLIWTPRNELLKVTPVVRDGDMDDVESYRYDAGSQRLLKVSKQKAASSVQTLRALYLPGIELRSVAQDNTETESLQVITLGEAGRAQVRVLHWEKGGPSEISNDQVRYSYDSLIGSCNLEVDSSGHFISMEEYYPYGGTAILTARNQTEVKYKMVRYSGKERDATGLYYYGYRYYQPWVGRWLSSDPAGTVDGLNLYRMVCNNPVSFYDTNGLVKTSSGIPSHKALEAVGQAEGVKIGQALLKLSDSQAQSQTQAIRKKINAFYSVKNRYGNAIQNTKTLKKAYDAVMNGQLDTFNNKYRDANSGQDELMSTATVRSIYSGIASVEKTAGVTFTQAQHDLAFASLEHVSQARLPTDGSGYNLGTGGVMQHPTGKGAFFHPPTVSSKGVLSSQKNHSLSDRARRDQVIGKLQNEVNNYAISGGDVMEPILAANLFAAQYTLEDFTGPATAANMNVLPVINQQARQSQSEQRDAIKHLDKLGQTIPSAPLATLNTHNSVWAPTKRAKNIQRSFSPTRFL